MLLAYGLLVAATAAVVLARTIADDAQLMQTRAAELRNSIEVLDRGGPPLTADRSFLPGRGHYDWYPLPQGDEPGIYLYLPVLGHALGERDPHILVKWLFLGLVVPLVLVYPLLFFELTGSVAAALLSPLLLAFNVSLMRDLDVYWIGSWTMLLGLPLLILVDRRWGRGSVYALVGVMLIAAFASSIRLYSGLPLLVSALLVVLRREPRWRRRAAAGAAIVLAYVSIRPIGLAVIKTVRDHTVSGTIAPEPDFSPFHNVYIGLGYVPNRLGIRYNDLAALEAARRRDPQVQYLGRGYAAAVRTAFFETARHHPGFVARALYEKLRATIRHGLARFWLGLGLLAAVLALGRRRDERARALALTAPALVILLLPPVLVVPHREYELGWLGAIGFLWMLGIGWALADWRDALRGLRSLHPWPVRRRVPVAAVGAAILVLAAWGPGAGTVAKDSRLSFYRSQASSYAAPTSRRPIARWTFADGTPRGWTPNTGASIAETRVTTSSGGDVQLGSPPVTVGPGIYDARVDGSVAFGGIALEVVDARGDTLASGHYWAGQHGSGEMLARFRTSRRTTVRIALGNWAHGGAASTWLLHRAFLAPAPRGVRVACAVCLESSA